MSLLQKKRQDFANEFHNVHWKARQPVIGISAYHSIDPNGASSLWIFGGPLAWNICTALRRCSHTTIKCVTYGPLMIVVPCFLYHELILVHQYLINFELISIFGNYKYTRAEPLSRFISVIWRTFFIVWWCSEVRQRHRCTGVSKHVCEISTSFARIHLSLSDEAGVTSFSWSYRFLKLVFCLQLIYLLFCNFVVRTKWTNIQFRLANWNRG